MKLSLPSWIRQSIVQIKVSCIFMRFLIVLLCAFWPRGHLLSLLRSREAHLQRKSKQKKATPVAGLLRKLPSSTRILAAGANSLRSNTAHPSPAKIRSDSAAPGEAARIVRFRQPVGRILESDACSQNKALASLWPMAKRRIQESDLRGWCCQIALFCKVIF